MPEMVTQKGKKRKGKETLLIFTLLSFSPSLI
jgi:hypothetical protein